MITDRQLALIVPELPRSRRAHVLPALQETLTRYSINTVERIAAFIANLLEESGEFNYTEEIWGPTPAQRAYDIGAKARELGNTPAADNDGRYRKGYGLIQTTGGRNQRRVLSALGLDPEQDPKILGQYPYAALSAGFYWADNKLNELADNLTGDWNSTERDVFTRIVRRVNGGTTHLDKRIVFYRRAINVLRTVPGLGSTPAEAPPVIAPVEGQLPPPVQPATVSTANAVTRVHQSKLVDFAAQQITPASAKSLVETNATRAKAPAMRLIAAFIAAILSGKTMAIIGAFVLVIGLSWIAYHYRRQIISSLLFYYSAIKVKVLE